MENVSISDLPKCRIDLAGLSLHVLLNQSDQFIKKTQPSTVVFIDKVDLSMSLNKLSVS